MRYIDADAATELARLTYCKHCKSYNGVMCRACAFDDAMSFIEDFPEADVVPRAELAREIFEEIEKHLFVIAPIEEFDGWARIQLADIMRLKKKYTEENHETRN